MEALNERGNIVYPDSDGEPMADNTRQFNWIVVLKENLDAVLPDFVGGDLLWYPVEGDPKTRRAPDVLVALGRPKGDRGSYRQWVEDNVAPQVVMEVLSPSNTVFEMTEKVDFYRHFGVHELYILDPDTETLQGWMRSGESLSLVPVVGSFRSPLLGITFELGEVIRVLHADGTPFKTHRELMGERDAAVQRAEAEKSRADSAEERARRLEARLRELGVDPLA